jgi:hypothetical protein
MSTIALGVSVAFLKQPDAVPGLAPLKKNKKYIYFELLLIHLGFLPASIRSIPPGLHFALLLLLLLFLLLGIP